MLPGACQLSALRRPAQVLDSGPSGRRSVLPRSSVSLWRALGGHLGVARNINKKTISLNSTAQK